MDLFHYLLIWISLAGLCLGSFYNVVILRSLSNESIIFPASKCPKCGHRLYFWHNIPVLSYIILRGKCYFCKEKISIQYPIVEITTMVLFVLAFYKFGISTDTIFMIFFFSCFLIMTVTDLKAKLVDCNIAIALAIGGIIWNFSHQGFSGAAGSLLGLIAGALIMEIIARSGYLFIKTRAMGEADTYVAGALGAIFGWQNIGLVLLYGIIASMIFIVPIFLYNQYKNNNKTTCILSVLFVLSILSFKGPVQNYYMLAILIILGLALSVSILRGIKKDENRNYLPFVPALTAGALFFIFFNINF